MRILGSLYHIYAHCGATVAVIFNARQAVASKPVVESHDNAVHTPSVAQHCHELGGGEPCQSGGEREQQHIVHTSLVKQAQPLVHRHDEWHWWGRGLQQMLRVINEGDHQRLSLAAVGFVAKGVQRVQVSQVHSVEHPDGCHRGVCRQRVGIVDEDH